MKKILISSMIFCVFLLSSCGRQDLENDYFENSTKNTFEQAYTLFSEYIERVRSNMMEYYPRGSQNAEMYGEDSYINAQLLSKDRIYRHEFYNYHLSDDRSFMRYSQLYYVTDTAFSIGSDNIDHCGTTKEGESCVVTERTSDDYLVKYGLTFLMEGEELYLDFMFTVNKTRLFHYVFLFYQDDQMDDVMEMTLHISNTSEFSYETMSYTKLVFGKSIEEYLCNNCDPNDATAGSLEYRYAELKEKPYQTYSYETSNILSFILLHLLDGSTYGDVFDGSTGERYNCHSINGFYETRSFAKYIRNTLVVEYSPSRYMINLQEVPGWDNLVKVPDEYNLYKLQYKDEVLSDQYFVKIQYENSEYPYFESSSSRLTTEEMSVLDIFGLQTQYDTNYFNDKFEQGTTQFEQAIANHDLNHDYVDNYATFMAYINQFKE